MSKIQAVADAVAAGKAKLVGGLVQEALDDGCQAVDVLNAMIDAMGVVGERFKNNEIFVPEMLVAARAMKKGVEVLKPHLASGSAGVCGKMVIGTVAGDLHDIGKNLVAMMIESAGFEVIDLGVDVPTEKLLRPSKLIRMLRSLDALLSDHNYACIKSHYRSFKCSGFPRQYQSYGWRRSYYSGIR